jgi:uncharacterized protein YkwD
MSVLGKFAAMRVVLVASAVALLVTGIFNRSGNATHDPTNGPMHKDKNGYDVILSSTDAYRRASGLSGLSTSHKLFLAASGYAAFLFKVDGAGHYSDGKDVAKRVNETGFAYCFVAENLYFYWSSAAINANEMADKAMTFWKYSPSHNANMLNKNSNHIGIGVASGQYGSRYIFKAVQVFAAPPGSCR